MVDLNNGVAIDGNDAANRPFLEKLQANILRGHGRNNALYIFGRFLAADHAANRAALRLLAPRVTSAWKQLLEERDYAAHHTPGDTVCNLLLSANGYRRLGFTDAEIRLIAPETPNARWAKSNFLEGMEAHGDELRDPAKADWEGEYKGRVDFLLLLADDDTVRLGNGAAAAKLALSPVATLWEEPGRALRTGTEDGYEHFGYLDGRSQPVFLQEHLRDEPAIARWNPVDPLNLVLVNDGGMPGDLDACGSFFVFRKLEQDVRGFVEDEEKLAAALDVPRELAGAYIIGRFRDGTPVLIDGQSGAKPGFNDFAFDNAGQSRCPFHAHIRKANPRGDLEARAGSRDRSHERINRIVRRAIPYGGADGDPRVTATSDPATLPRGGVGLLFGCFQARIAMQFAQIQAMWISTPSHPQGGAGVDPLLAADPPNATQTSFAWPKAYRDPNVTAASLQRHVKMLGGEFFFAPSVPFLRAVL
jgi:Dyp-type peroxidase family